MFCYHILLVCLLHYSLRKNVVCASTWQIETFPLCVSMFHRLIKVWTFISCFDRDLWEMKQTNKFDTDQLFYYILNTWKMWHQSQPSVAIKEWTFISCFDRILKNWSRLTNLTLTNHFITYWTSKNCVIRASQVV